MAGIRKSLAELFLVGLVGLILGATANAFRSSGSLKWTKAYFASKDFSAPSARAAVDEAAKDSQAPTRPPSEKPVKHPYQEITTDEVAAIVNDPNAAVGLNVIVDARSEAAYADGHIEGAIRCYHYELDSCIDDVLGYALGAEKVIVYCNGGSCEDSKFMCQELIDRDVPYEAVYLYPGGWTDWKKNNLPYVVGAQ